jgi:hypothetical protein
MEDGSVIALLDVGMSITRAVVRVVGYPSQCECVQSGREGMICEGITVGKQR